MEKHFWEQSGHWENYREMMFVTELPDERVFCCKPMNCPGHVQIYKHGLKSYRDLPLKIAEFGKVHRYEPSGALHGLLRVRHFTQDDAHIFITEEQLEAECLAVNDLLLSIYEDFGFTDIVVKLDAAGEARRRRRALGSRGSRHGACAARDRGARAGRIKTAINPGEGAFYGPKFEYVLRDAIGRDWQCGTTQVDFNLPGRLGAFYIDEHSEKKTPVMIHRAIFGSLERFTGVLVENFAGHLPLWLAPQQVIVCTIVSDADAYAEEVVAALHEAGFAPRPTCATRRSTTRCASTRSLKFPFCSSSASARPMSASSSIRRLSSQAQSVVGLPEAIAELAKEAVPPDLKRARFPTGRRRPDAQGGAAGRGRPPAGPRGSASAPPAALAAVVPVAVPACAPPEPVDAARPRRRQVMRTPGAGLQCQTTAAAHASAVHAVHLDQELDWTAGEIARAAGGQGVGRRRRGAEGEHSRQLLQ